MTIYQNDLIAALARTLRNMGCAHITADYRVESDRSGGYQLVDSTGERYPLAEDLDNSESAVRAAYRAIYGEHCGY